MAQHDYDIANQSGANFRADLNNALDAIVSNNSGSSEPSTTFAYEWWIDTSANVLKLRNSANNAWITLPLSITADNSTSGALTVNGNLSTTGTLDVNGGEIILDSDADTSITSDTDDQIDFKIGNVDVATLTNSHLVLKGTTPKITIGDGGEEDTALIFDGNAQDFYIGLDDSADDLFIGTGSTVGTNGIVVIENGGNVGIGETVPLGKVHIKNGDSGASSVSGDKDELVIENNGHSGITTLATDSTESGMFFGHTSDTRAGEIYTHYDNTLMTIGTRMTSGAVRFLSDNGSERMRIPSGSGMLLGSSSAIGAGFLLVNCSPASFNHIVTRPTTNATYNALRMINNANTVVGTISVGTSVNTVTYGGTSDYRLKENIQPMEQGLERVKKLKPVQFDWKETGESSEGFIAHEIQEAGWDLGVVGEKDGKEMQEVEYGKLTPLLVKAIQELEEKVKKLEG